MNKEQIEEMAKERIEIQDIMKLLGKCSSINPMYRAEVATVIYGNNYRKLPEDSVVLTREEYDELTLTKQSIFDMLEEREDKARKETAKEILKRGKYCMPSGLRDWIKEHYSLEEGE